MSRQVKFGVRIHQHGYTFDDLKRIWTQADRLGYHSATLYDLLNSPALECWTTLSALAAITERIRLTPLVLANTYRPPALLAKMSATLDVISRGRLELGIGAGGGGGDHQASGISFPSTAERVRMLEEAVELIKKSWTEPKAAFQGRYYSLDQSLNEPKPVQLPHPPLLIGGHGETHLLKAVAGHADICNIGFEMSLEEHQVKMEILQRHCDGLGRDSAEIEVTHNTRVVIAETKERFEALAAQGAASANVSLTDYKDSLARAIAGTPGQCIQQLSRYVDSGIRYFFLLFPDPISSENLKLFASEVMPHFAIARDR
jgi:alkanesulfonate monooxygenase SsuD/methylene tetrahydromethanopterin reductase-like flavin-dependent oxidoreductase (luciferase family)